jgi:hypothetical protein
LEVPFPARPRKIFFRKGAAGVANIGGFSAGATSNPLLRDLKDTRLTFNGNPRELQ